MEKRNESRKWKTAGRFPAEILFLTGFLVGNIIPNLIWKMEWKQKTLASFYLIRNFAGKDISGGAYLLEVLRDHVYLYHPRPGRSYQYVRHDRSDEPRPL